MSQFADGGLLGSKPYASSGAYINRMSNYCGSCRYDVKQRIGKDACPFNALYWDFLARNQRKLASNPRMALPYRNWDRMPVEDRAAIREQAARFLDSLD
jgi:deoxyribodipyrimidine photolyase-related protein